MVAKYQKKRSSVWLQQGRCCGRTALWRANFVSPIALPLWPLRQYDAHTTTSRRPGHALSATIGDLTVMLLRHMRPHYAAWTLHRVCCAHTTSALRSYGDHRRFAVYLAPFHCKLERFQLIFFKCDYEIFLSWKRIMISFKCESFVFKYIYNVNHKGDK